MESPEDPVILSAVRTPIGKRDGALAGVHPADLLGRVLLEGLARSGVPAGEVDQVLVGCVTQAGEQAYNIARTASLAAGLPEHVPGTTLDAQCGSSQQAVNLAAALIASGANDLVMAAGVESMSRLPLRTAVRCGPGDPLSTTYRHRYEVTDQGEAAERIAGKWGISREECDDFAARSQACAIEATEAGHFAEEMVPVDVDGVSVTLDGGLRRSTAAALSALPAAFRPDGRHTAGNSSQISDGASAAVLSSRRWAEEHGVAIRARILDHAIVAVEPSIKLTGPIPATHRILQRQRLSERQIDLFEVNEAFASVVLAWLKEFDVPLERVNVNGGAIALGHPVGATGARLIATALHQLERNGGGRGLITMCCGGGLGTATLIETP